MGWVVKINDFKVVVVYDSIFIVIYSVRVVWYVVDELPVLLLLLACRQGQDEDQGSTNQHYPS